MMKGRSSLARAALPFSSHMHHHRTKTTLARVRQCFRYQYLANKTKDVLATFLFTLGVVSIILAITFLAYTLGRQLAAIAN